MTGLVFGSISVLKLVCGSIPEPRSKAPSKFEFVLFIATSQPLSRSTTHSPTLPAPNTLSSYYDHTTMQAENRKKISPWFKTLTLPRDVRKLLYIFSTVVTPAKGTGLDAPLNGS